MSRIFLLCLLLLAGCASTTPSTMVHQPMTARPAAPSAQAGNGAIYQAGAVRPLFEDRRARMVGDTLTISLVEKSGATKSSSSSANRSDTLTAGVPTISGMPGKTFQGLNISASDASKFAGSGGSAANNTFTGTITVTVIEALPNGNLLVSGEKKLSINQGGDEFIRFSGVVNPANITTANTVQSVQVADARLEYKQNGYIDSAQVMGWLSRFFLSVLPF
jgi:flagellar L-ring protein precursor FlgH